MANVSGTSGNDFIHRLGDGRTPPSGFNEITGITEEADNIDGREGNDQLFGNGGDDFLSGGSGADTLDGGDGTDFADYFNATTGVTASLVNPAVNTGDAAGDTYTSIEGLHGSAFDDLLIGDANNNTLLGGAGLDRLFGGDGNDFLFDDSGAASEMNGEAGNDTIYGGPGNDYITGGDGDDVIIGGENRTRSFGDSLFGGAGNDYIVAANILDPRIAQYGSVLDGGTGADQLWSLVGFGQDYAVGGAGDDIIATGGGNDYIFGGDGNDTIVAGTGIDYIYGGAGNDFIYTDDPVLGAKTTDYVYVSGLSGFGTGIDTVADFTPRLSNTGFSGDVAVILSTPGLTSFADVQANMIDIGVYMVINLSATDQLYLYNVDPDQLTADNFLFL
jgi:Ca2+-binding RTX toxin-like protein